MTASKDNLASSYLTQIKDYFNKGAKEGVTIDIDDELSKNPAFSDLVNNAPSLMLVFNFKTLVYDYFSSNVEKIFGYKVEQLKGLSGAEFGISMFYPDHLNVLIQMNDVLNKYYFEYAGMKRVRDTRASFTAKIKKSDGQYIWCLMQTMILEESSEGFPLRTLSFITDVTDIKTDTKVDFTFAVKSKTDPGYETVYSIHYDGAESNVLSRREIEIINCVGKGMRTQEIAEKLNISAHTVSTHKRNILRKTGKDNLLQLLN